MEQNINKIGIRSWYPDLFSSEKVGFHHGMGNFVNDGERDNHRIKKYEGDYGI